MADKWNSGEGDEPTTGAITEENIRGVANEDDDEFDDADELDEDEAEDEEGSGTF